MNAFSKRKASAFRTAVAVPATLLIGLGGTALAASPALADSAPADSSTTATAPADPAATASTPTDGAVSDGQGATDPATAPASPAAPSAPAPTQATPPAPVSRVAAAAPTDLTVTSPVPDDDTGVVTIHGPRTFTIEGTAPVGSKLEVTDSDGDVVAHTTTTATTFSIPVTFTADDGYDQFISVYGTSGKKDLTEDDFEVVFDAPQSPTPTITSPTGTVVYETTYAPFFDAPMDVVEVSGTGQPGDSIGIEFDQTDDQGDTSSSFSFDGSTVAVDGTWTVEADVPDFGTWTMSAVQTTLNEQGDETSVESDPSNTVQTTFDEKAGTVAPPLISQPSYGDGSFLSAFDTTRASIQQEITHPARTQSAKTAAAKVRHTDLATKGSRLKAAAASGVGGLGVASGDDGDESIDPTIAQIGIPVVGRADAAKPGLVDFTVSGTGTPGDDIVLYGEDGDIALSYFGDLYPSFFEGFQNGQTPLPPVSNTPAVPAVKTTGGSSGDPAATASLPADDGSIVVKADGTWSTTLSRKPGEYIVTAFAVDQSAHYSVAGPDILVHLTGDPAVAPAATGPELAFTGSQHSTAIGLGGLAAIVAGGAMMLFSRRRRAAAAVATPAED
ncbi:LPXTG cell wall anchor domain-containing protein [Frondihabitans australicus]|uniref:LPXTG-motif cell wall-anchored protein n=1 Tax=Frondihabitans australicus TaxID=386892 RepID=A0A495IHH0_9MICO|nr:LPXTG cell wall anchor domain-containing protein [Frondihabitans australicus]RKR74605.1 LPXTG-motif cell wall-anchored protein [Frondihabitans australicus]